MPENQKRQIIKGIYKIICKSNGNFYIGKAEDLEKRWRSHKRQLNNGSHNNPKLQKDWTEYGEEKFEFELIHRWRRGENLSDSEEIWIAHLKPQYNIVQGKRA